VNGEVMKKEEKQALEAKKSIIGLSNEAVSNTVSSITPCQIR